MIRFAHFDENDLTPILNWPEMECEPEPAVVKIDCDRKTVSAEPREYHLFDMPVDVLYRHQLRFEIPNNITGRALNRVFQNDEFRRLCERIINGYDTKYNGKNYVGVYSEDAEAAMTELQRWLDTNIDDDDCVRVITPDEYVCDNPYTIEIIDGNSYELIKKVAEKICEALVAENCVIVGGARALAEQMIDYRNSLA